MRKYTVAVAQMDSQNNKAENLAIMAEYIEEAGRKGAKLIAFPEVATGWSEDIAYAEHIPGPTTEFLSQKAKECGVWVHAGSISETNRDGNKTYNTSVLINPQGEIVATYRKLHNFDMVLPDGVAVRESDRKQAGNQVITVDTELGKIGMAICYDMRFPELFRLMMLEGAQIVILPANFTMATGKDHWEPILRARAIENGCYLLAPNQIGKKEKFDAYGNSMIVDPWGTVIGRASQKTGITMAEVDLDYLEEIRRKNPILQNRREDIYQLRKV